jgi:hypothetical protein
VLDTSVPEASLQLLAHTDPVQALLSHFTANHYCIFYHVHVAIESPDCTIHEIMGDNIFSKRSTVKIFGNDSSKQKFI